MDVNNDGFITFEEWRQVFFLSFQNIFIFCVPQLCFCCAGFLDFGRSLMPWLARRHRLLARPVAAHGHITATSLDKPIIMIAHIRDV